MQIRNNILLLQCQKQMTHILGYGVMVTLQILVLSFQVRILVAQQKPKHKASVFLFYIGLMWVKTKLVRDGTTSFPTRTNFIL